MNELLDVIDAILSGKHVEVDLNYLKQLAVLNGSQQVAELISQRMTEWYECIPKYRGSTLYAMFTGICCSFMKLLEIVPNMFPEDSDIFMVIVVSFTPILREAEIMESVSKCICTQIGEYILAKNDDFEPLKITLTVLKSMKAVDELTTAISNMDVQTHTWSRQPADCVDYLRNSFCQIERAKRLDELLPNAIIAKQVFTKAITGRKAHLCDGIQPLIGYALLQDEQLVWKILTYYDMFGLEAPILWEPCCDFIYDYLFQITEKDENVLTIVNTFNKFFENYSYCFENNNGAITKLENIIRIFLNNPRINFAHYWTEFLNSGTKISEADMVQYTMRIETSSRVLANVCDDIRSILSTVIPTRKKNGKDLPIKYGRENVSDYLLSLCKEKILVVLGTKGSLRRDILLFDSFLLVRRKVLPDQIMINKALDELMMEGKIEQNDGVVHLCE